MADCDARLAKYRSALEAGADPAVVAGWIKEVEADRLAAERELASTAATAQPLTEAEIRALVTSQRKVLRSLAGRPPNSGRPSTARRWACGSHTTPRSASIEVEARPACTKCVSEGVCGFRTWETSQVGDVSRHRRHRSGGLR